MSRLSMLSALFGATALSTVVAVAQTPDAKPTVKDRVDAAIATVTGDPLRNVDVDLKHVLDATADFGGKPIEKLSPQEARQQPLPGDGLKALLQKEGKNAAPDDSVTMQAGTYDGAVGPLPARIYKPAGENGPLPIVLYFHGGGFVIADIEKYDAAPRALANQAKAVVISAEYRRAPEDKFPAAHDDAFAAYQWALKNASQFNGDPKRIALAGESAGGRSMSPSVRATKMCSARSAKC